MITKTTTAAELVKGDKAYFNETENTVLEVRQGTTYVEIWWTNEDMKGGWWTNAYTFDHTFRKIIK